MKATLSSSSSSSSALLCFFVSLLMIINSQRNHNHQRFSLRHQPVSWLLFLLAFPETKRKVFADITWQHDKSIRLWKLLFSQENKEIGGSRKRRKITRKTQNLMKVEMRVENLICSAECDTSLQILPFIPASMEIYTSTSHHNGIFHSVNAHDSGSERLSKKNNFYHLSFLVLNV